MLWEWADEIALCIVNPIALDQITPSRRTESESGSGPSDTGESLMSWIYRLTKDLDTALNNLSPRGHIGKWLVPSLYQIRDTVC